MNEWIKEVWAFQKIFESKPETQDKLLLLRYKLVNEEIGEFNAALNAMLVAPEASRPKVELLDAVADSIVVLIGTANALGMDLDTAMRRVFESNLTKLGEDGRPFYNSDGKVMKGPNFTPPDLSDLV
ncbi:MAG: phosphoribosyl-ATP diphosphatase [Epsilonproteobacteria bacterium]|nr:phosphoribosyl-ATP diphosphatase [Campylobacterota bacterium]